VFISRLKNLYLKKWHNLNPGLCGLGQKVKKETINMKSHNVKNWLKKNASKVFGGVAAVCGAIGMSLAPTQAHAVPVLDLTAAGTAITAELTPAIAAAMPIAGTIIAVGVGYKLFRRFVK
jgi:hypothetical protein